MSPVTLNISLQYPNKYLKYLVYCALRTLLHSFIFIVQDILNSL